MDESAYLPVKENIISAVGNGIGHIIAATRTDYNGDKSMYEMNNEDYGKFVGSFTFINLFWLLLSGGAL